MALPEGFSTPEMEALLARVQAMDENELQSLLPLQAEDLQMIGALIQHYCFIDFNLRRAVEIFHGAKLLTGKPLKLYPNVPDSMLTDTVAAVVFKEKENAEELEAAILHLGMLNDGRLYRNLFSHFSSKRIEDSYVFMSKSARDAKNILGKELGKEEAHIGVAQRANLFALTNDIGDHSKWLARKIPTWYLRYPAR